MAAPQYLYFPTEPPRQQARRVAQASCAVDFQTVTAHIHKATRYFRRIVPAVEIERLKA
jgi:hypothetical protein